MYLLVTALTFLVIGFFTGILLIIGLSRTGKTTVALPIDSQVHSLHPQTIETLSTMRDAVAVIDDHDNVLFCSPQARNIGIIRGTRVGFPQILELVRKVRLEKKVCQIDLNIDRGPGISSLQLTVRASFIQPEEVLIFAQEVGARVRMDETRKDFIANVTHELKTPVGALQLLSEAIEQGADDPQLVRKFAERISFESQRLSGLVSQIINLSRLQSDEPLLRAEEVKVFEAVNQAVSHCRETAELRGISIAVSADEQLVVIGDLGQLVDAIENLLSNAIAYSDRDDRVAITCKQVIDGEDNLVEISVADNGIGIQPEDIDRIFERFYRSDYSRSRQDGGTGLGLSIVKHIVTVHGGSISVWSKPDEGSTFTIRIPSYIDQPAQPVGSQPANRHSLTRRISVRDIRRSSDSAGESDQTSRLASA